MLRRFIMVLYYYIKTYVVHLVSNFIQLCRRKLNYYYVVAFACVLDWEDFLLWKRRTEIWNFHQFKLVT